MQQGKETKEFQDLVKQMLSDMKIFKQLLRKSLNLIQGMEMMNQVNLSSIFTILELYPLFIIQGYMQAVGGVGRGGGHGELDHYLSTHCWTFSTSCLQQDLTTARKVLQKPPLSPQLFVNGLPSSHCGELSILQQSR